MMVQRGIYKLSDKAYMALLKFAGRMWEGHMLPQTGQRLYSISNNPRVIIEDNAITLWNLEN